MAHQFFDMLQKDHQKVKDILDQLSNTTSRAVKTREDLFKKLKEELLPHMKGEEKHFYSALKSEGDTKKKALEALEEHHVADMVLKELDKQSQDTDEWGAKINVFKEIVEHHIEEEENEVFKEAGKALDDETLDKIMNAFETEKKTVKKKLK